MTWLQTAAANALRVAEEDGHVATPALEAWIDAREAAGMPVDRPNEMPLERLYELVERDANCIRR